MNFYLIASYHRRDEMRLIRNELERQGHRCTARWLDTDFVFNPTAAAGAPLEQREGWAQQDFQDIQLCDVAIAFTELPQSPYSRGGRHVELGIAIAIAACRRVADTPGWSPTINVALPHRGVSVYPGGGPHRVMVVGHRENIFCYLGLVEFFNSTEELVTAMAHEA